MTLYSATQNQAALELTGKIVANPALAVAILEILRKFGEDVELLSSLDLKTLQDVKDVLPKSQLPTEQTLRSENRIQDNPEILAKLGFKGKLPSIPQELLEECACTSGTLVLRFNTTVLDYQAHLNAALGSDMKHLHLYVEDRAKSIATTNEEPNWINVPNTVRDDTLAMSKAEALNQVPGSETCDPMDIVLMLGYNNLQTGEQLAGFANRYTFTSQKNTLVGSPGGGIYLNIHDNYDAFGNFHIGLAPRLAPKSKI